MFNFVCYCRILAYARNCSIDAISSLIRAHKQELHFLQTHQPFSSSSIVKTSEKRSTVVSYLINSCGLSPERAISASKYVNFKAPENADSVVAFFKKHHFTDAQISTLIYGRPQILSANPDKTILPKLEFLQSVGFSSFDIPKLVCASPRILHRSLRNRLIPVYNFLKNLLHSSEDVVVAVKQYPEVLQLDIENTVAPNIQILRDIGVGKSHILFCLKCAPRVLGSSPARFKEIVERVKKMGFNPQRQSFVQGVNVIGRTASSTWKRKVEVYKKCGWTEEEVLVAFRKFPRCMLASESKILGAMDFLVREMGFNPSIFANRPHLISVSLRKTLIPRCSVVQVLLSKGLVDKNFSLQLLLECPENQFLERFIIPHKEGAPELLNLYQEKLKIPN